MNHSKDTRMTSSCSRASFFLAKMTCFFTFLFSLCACHTLVFFNKDTSNLEWAEPSHYQSVMTHHEGVVGLMTGKALSLESACGKDGWQVIKTESTAKDALIGLIFNPLYSSSSVLIDCKNQRVAQQ